MSGEKERKTELLLDGDVARTLDCINAALRALGSRLDKLQGRICELEMLESGLDELDKFRKRLRKLEERYGVEPGGPLEKPKKGAR